MLDPTRLFRPLAVSRGRALARLDPARAQARVLAALLETAAGTRFGRAHGFASIRTPAEFRRAVPLREWADFWREYWESSFPIIEDASWPGRIPYFAETSGTTSGITKHIPVTRAMLRGNRRAALDVVLNHLRRSPSSRFFAGPSLILGGSTALSRLGPGVASGDLSGIVADTMPAWTRGRALPRRETALIADWDVKLDRIAREAAHVDLRSISGTPSWLLLLFERLLATRPDVRNLAELFPSLELIMHGGVGFGPYRSRFETLLRGGRARPQEVYPASEGFIAYADGDASDPGLRMLLDNGLFFEFVPLEELGRENPTRHWVADVQPGIDYALILSTNAGLFGYVIGDVVRIVSRDPVRLVVTGRTAHFLSAFGEHLSGGELDRAIEAASAAIGAHVADYTAGVIPPDEHDARGGHVFVVECVPVPDETGRLRFADVLDRVLADNNADYAAHRAGGRGMRPPEIRPVAPGTFAGWMKARGRFGGQNKVPRVIADPDLLASLIEQDATGRTDP